MLLPDLYIVIDLRSVLAFKTIGSCMIQPKVMPCFSLLIFLLVLMTRPFFSTDPLTLVDHVPFQRCKIHRENVYVPFKGHGTKNQPDG